MAGLKAFVFCAAAAALAASAASAAVTRASDQVDATSTASSAECLVEVRSAQTAGAFSVTRAVRNGQCVCIATAGPGTNEQVSALQAARSCDGAPPAVAGGAAGGSLAILGLLGPGTVGGAVAAAAGGSSSPR